MRNDVNAAHQERIFSKRITLHATKLSVARWEMELAT